MRKTPLVNGEIYHVYNRGVDKREIFSAPVDFERFLLGMEYFNRKKPVGSVYEYQFIKDKDKKSEENLVEFISYVILPNHFHFVLKQNVDGGISEFMKRLQGGYTNYFNEKYKRSGALFQGRFKSIHVHTDDYLFVLLGYVNYNDVVHAIPNSKKHFVRSSMAEIESSQYRFLTAKNAGNYILKMFETVDSFKKHCKEIADIIRAHRSGELIPGEYLIEED